MDDFLIYLRLGFEHITDPSGYDHIIFIVALCAVYTIQQWRQVLVLVTAFTIGHSITLALATLQIIHYKTEIIELLIPITILITAITNIFFRDFGSQNQAGFQARRQAGRYLLALSFGLIHGMGFSNYLRSLLGREATIVQPLLAFNIGLELGQLVIVSIVLGITYVALTIIKVRQLLWVQLISGIVIGMSISLIGNHEYMQELFQTK